MVAPGSRFSGGRGVGDEPGEVHGGGTGRRAEDSAAEAPSLEKNLPRLAGDTIVRPHARMAEW